MRIRSSIALLFAVSLLGCSDDTRKTPTDGGTTVNADTDGGGTVDGDENPVGNTLPSDELAVCGQGWCWVSPRPYGSTLHAAHGVRGDVFLVGSGGLVLQRIDGSWTAEIVGPAHLRAVHSVSSDLAYAVGLATDERNTGYVYRFDGASWSLAHTITLDSAPPGAVGPLFTPAAVWASDDEVYVGLANRIDHFDGTTWTTLDVPGGDLWITDIACSMTCIAVGHDAAPLSSASNGFVWRLDLGAFIDERFDPGPINAIDIQPASGFVAAGANGSQTVFVRGRPGSWSAEEFHDIGAVADLAVGNSDEWVVATDFTFWDVYSRALARDWVDEAAPANIPGSLGPARDIPAIHVGGDETFIVTRSRDITGEIWRHEKSEWETFSPSNDIAGDVGDIAAGGSIAVAVTDTSHTRWDIETTEPTTFEGGARQVWISKDDRVFLLRETLEEVQSDGTAEPVPGAPSRIDHFFALSPDTIVAALDEFVWLYDGATWTSIDLPDDVGVAALWARAENDLYAAVSARTTRPLLWRFDGAQWSPIEGTDTSDLSDVFALTGNSGEVLIAGEESSSARTIVYDGSTFDNSLAPGLVTDATALDDTDFLVTTRAGEVYRGTPAGWELESQLSRHELTAVAVSPSGSAWVGGLASTVLRYLP